MEISRLGSSGVKSAIVSHLELSIDPFDKIKLDCISLIYQLFNRLCKLVTARHYDL